MECVFQVSVRLFPCARDFGYHRRNLQEKSNVRWNMKNFSKPAGTLFFFASMIAAQTTATVPVEKEPQHKVVFKNDFVRVIDATLPAGYVTLNHAHDADNISVTIANGREGEAGQRGLGRASFAKGGYAHTVSNSNPGLMRYIVVEPFKSDHPGSAAAALSNHALETENDRVRIYRIKLAPGESMQSHSHAAGRVEVTVLGPAGPGNAVWIAGGENRPLKSAAGGAMEVVEIEPR
jgi:quercetin dioxygenase-like cupin family protein